jgi:hypothetical protein
VYFSSVVTWSDPEVVVVVVVGAVEAVVVVEVVVVAVEEVVCALSPRARHPTAQPTAELILISLAMVSFMSALSYFG